MFNKFIFLVVFTLFAPVFASAQNCTTKVSGVVQDKHTGAPILYANIYLKESQQGEVTDSLGHFSFTSVCPGDYHLVVSHIGCETQEFFVHIQRDTIMTVAVNHNSQLLDEVAVIGSSGKATTQDNQAINGKRIAENSEENLATMLETMSGVSTIKNGGGIAKPVVHGLTGNRLTILNNGVSQSGQQWGADHSPEIDPLVANRITVIKGVGALEYQGNSLGSVILVEPHAIDNEPHLHGKARYFYESNGRGNGLNLEMQQYTKKLAWRTVGTLKKSGDTRAPSYFLRNTGHEEANIALQLEKKWTDKWLSNLYFSSYNATLGVLRGSHIGNLTDLEDALTRDVPFYTEDDFSNRIDAPYQKVNHHLLKLHTKYQKNEKEWITFTYAGQYDLRKEFDVRRSGRSEDPALSLEQLSHFFELKYERYLAKEWKLKTGVQVNRVNNTNLPETGILPLIPDYIAYEYGAFAMLHKRFAATELEFGARYDYEDRRVAAISISVPREIVRYENQFGNLSLMGGINRTFFNLMKLSYNVGYASRNPEVNELYSNGLHQGVSGIEEGDPNLKTEFSVKNNLGVQAKIKKKLVFETLFYIQNFKDYIFLNPSDEIRLTVRGAFPVFKYEQTNAQILGLDASATYSFTKQFHVTGTYSYLKGQDISNNMPLIYMPANNLYGEISYQITSWKKLQNIEFQINNRYVFEQKNILASQDFLAPPPAYNLLGMKVSAERQLKKLHLKLFVKANNILNETYRDYLNRMRYFADDLGVNIIVGAHISF